MHFIRINDSYTYSICNDYLAINSAASLSNLGFDINESLFNFKKMLQVGFA